VYERPLGGLDARPRALGEIVRLGDEPPCPRQPQVVAERLEGPNRRLRDRDQLARGHVGPCKKAQKSPLHECVRSEAIVTGCDRGVQYPDRPAEVAAQALCDSDRGNEADASGIVWRQERDGTREEVDRSRCVGPDERASARSAEPLGGTSGHCPVRVANRSELGPVAKRLLEVVAHDLLVLSQAFGRSALEP
jgi:hypothetical protein